MAGDHAGANSLTMTPRVSKFLAVVTLALFTACAFAQSATEYTQPLPPTPPVRTQHAMVVSIHHCATDAGVEVLHEGGNAVDAAVAVAFALAVVYPAAGNLGGGGFMLIRPGSSKLAHGQPHFLDFREKAPTAARANMYLDAQGNLIPHASTQGAKSSGVPGTVAGLVYAEQHYGRLGLRRVMAPAIRLAHEGFVLTADEADNLHSSKLAKYPTSRRIFQRDGNFYQPGDRLLQPELARTLERIAKDPGTFYKGAMARTLAAYEKANGGLITARDLARYQVKERKPLLGHYRGLDVLTAPPPSSGGIVLIEILNILSGYNLPQLGPDRSAAQVHLITEAFRRAYMDRADFLGDPDFNPHMPLRQMASPAYAAAWRKTIDPVKPSPSATLVRPAGFMPTPPNLAPIAPESHQTTHFSVVDAQGNAVAMTYTLNFGFGNGMTVDKLGFLMNDEMDDFTSKIGAPNGFGLIQGPANAIAPGKRPLSCMTPTIVSDPPVCKEMRSRPSTKNLSSRPQRSGAERPASQDARTATTCTPGKLRLVLGSPGGSTIITTVANDLISVVDNGLDIQAAADAPRFHHQYLPDILQFEKSFPQDVLNKLTADGYTTERAGAKDFDDPGTWGDSELIAIDPETGELTGGQDLRHHYGKAAGY